jgi:hypothetical protein
LLRKAQARAEAAEIDRDEIKLVLESQDLRLHEFKARMDAAEARARELEGVLQAQRELHIEDVRECWENIR